MPLKIIRRPALEPTVRSSCSSERPRTKAPNRDSPARCRRSPITSFAVRRPLADPFDFARRAAAIT
jgi:hypothetical protein